MATPASRKKTVTTRSPALVGDSATYARRVWLAGLGAYARVGQEGLDYFRELVRVGEGVERQGKAQVNEKVEAVSDEVDKAGKGLSAVKNRVGLQVEKIEQAFDARVAGALNRLGIPSRQDVQELSAKLDVLSALLDHVVRTK